MLCLLGRDAIDTVLLFTCIKPALKEALAQTSQTEFQLNKKRELKHIQQRDDSDNVVASLSKDASHSLKLDDVALKKDREIVLAAVRQNG